MKFKKRWRKRTPTDRQLGKHNKFSREQVKIFRKKKGEVEESIKITK